MLTATASPIDRVVGLELGADDYIAKPCELRELRRGSGHVAAQFSVRALAATSEAAAAKRRKTNWSGSEQMA